MQVQIETDTPSLKKGQTLFFLLSLLRYIQCAGPLLHNVLNSKETQLQQHTTTITIFSASTVSNMSLGCPASWFRAGHYCYHAGFHRTSWYNASRACQSLQSSLVKVDDLDKKVNIISSIVRFVLCFVTGKFNTFKHLEKYRLRST